MKKMPCEDTGTRGHRVTTEAETSVCSCKPRNSEDGGPPRKPGEPRRGSAASRREQVPTPALWTSSLRTGTVSLCGLKPLGLRRSVRATLGQGQGDDGLMAEWGEGVEKGIQTAALFLRLKELSGSPDVGVREAMMPDLGLGNCSVGACALFSHRVSLRYSPSHTG